MLANCYLGVLINVQYFIKLLSTRLPLLTRDSFYAKVLIISHVEVAHPVVNIQTKAE